MYVICTDLEGVFTPEVWINVAKTTGIEELRMTTRDEPDYNKLMKRRIEILRENNLRLKDIQDVIAGMEPLPGAFDFLEHLKERCPVIIVSDTFVEFADPLMKKLGRPTLFCNSLDIDKDGFIVSHVMRQEDGKRHVAESLKLLNYTVIGMGDSYNDITMIQAADIGILFRPPDNVIKDYPELPVTNDYEEVKKELSRYI